MLDALIIQKTLRVPLPAGPAGDGATVARQFDSALLSVGFKASRPLLDHLGAMDAGAVIDTAVTVLAAVKRLVGDHVEHNVYFKDFPANVPDTMEFWLGLLATAMVNAGGEPVSAVSMAGVNLLDLPGYGKYQHSYREMATSRTPLAPAATDRVTILHLGDSLEVEAARLYVQLAGSPTPLQEDDLELLGLLAALCADMEQPKAIPIRESRAIVNRVRLAHGKPLLVDTVTDVLRLACAVSGGDVTLESSTRFVSLARRDRRALLAALEGVVAADSRKLEDVAARREPWKRLGERLHAREYEEAYPHAAGVFQVARGEFTVPSLAARVEALYKTGGTRAAVGLLGAAPGMLLRQVDRAARSLDRADMGVLTDAVGAAAPRASGRVLLSLREHLANRGDLSKARIYVNRRGRAWVEPDFRPPIDQATIGSLTALLDGQITDRLPACAHLVVDPAVYGAAVPLSGKNTGTGFQIMPRGSRTPVAADHLRFFVYWKQAQQTTDFDLSALLLDEKFAPVGQLSYTNLSGFGGVHSGDITSAPNGASEFIDLDLRKVTAKYILPQVNIYSGEGFDEVAESFVGYMERSPGQLGKPFEASTVRMRSDLRGTSRVALPLALEHGKDGWEAVWMHLSSSGRAWGNRVEDNRMSTALLAQSILGREYLTVRHLVDLMRPNAAGFTEWKDGVKLDGPVTFIGIDRPDGLPEGSEVFTLDRLNALVPA